MGLSVVKFATKPKKQKQHKSISDYEKAHHGNGEQWINTDYIKLARIKTDRKTKNPEYIKELAQSIKGRKQVNPAVVREFENSYELISGECRFDAAKLNSEELLCRVVDWNNDECIAAIVSENDKREDLCDYDKALFYIEIKGDLSIRQFADKHGLNRGYVDRLLKVGRIPQTLRNSLPMAGLSASQLADIAGFVVKGSAYEDALLKLAPLLSQIVTGERKVTWKVFLSRITDRVNPPQKKNTSYIFRRTGKNIDSLRYKDNKIDIKLKKGMTEEQLEKLARYIEKLYG
ncbi:Nucleoid occlusion protein (plasmid) [Piscirickettsia salmonis]|nr:Nucleoid occlusion protein [Piscirickettsia salmonis]QGP62045.1 Nucleoid occlusion protein [Piscirickettsia salmonis]QGP66719.1 Nucleoid occlusion protein [Piscirickettsia salmonis]